MGGAVGLYSSVLLSNLTAIPASPDSDWYNFVYKGPLNALTANRDDLDILPCHIVG